MPALYPENTSYGTGSTPSSGGRIGFSKLRASAMKNVSDLNNNAGQTKQPGVPANLQSLSSITQNSVNTPGEPMFPANQPIADAFSEKYKNLQQYRNETGEALTTQTSQPWYTPETPNTKIANMPSFLGAGQYLTDPNSANVANERSYIPGENKAILGTRDSRLYQVDHIIPLWAGGADTIANKEILTTADHAVKSKAQAVPFTLMANGVITPGEAKNMAINWQDKDVTGIPASAESGGFMDVNLAQQKYAEWNRVKKVTFKDVLKQVPEVLKSITKPLSAKTGEDDTTQFFKSLAGGLVSEASFGVLPYQNESTDTSAKVGGFIGKVAGNVIAFASLGGIIGEAGKVASKAKYLKSFANSAKIADDVFAGAQATREGAQVASAAAGTIGRTIPIAIKGAGVGDAITGGKLGLNNIVKNIKINNVLKTAGMMNAYGQIRITAPALVGLEKMPDLNQRFHQAMVDTAYGGLLGQAGHTLPGYASVGAGAFTIGLISGDDAENASLSAFTMMALHGLGQGAANKNAKLPTLEEAMNRVGDQTASQHIFDKTGIKVDKLDPNSAVDVRAKLNDVRAKLAAKGDVDLTDIAKMRLQDEVAIRQLEKGGMTTAVRRQADIDDMSSIGDKLKNKEQLQDTSTPDEVVQTAIKNEDHLFDNTPLEKTDGGIISGAPQPSGRFPLTGLGGKIGKGEPMKRTDYFFNAKDQGLAANNLLLIERSELEPFFNKTNVDNSILRSKDIKNNDFSLMQHPENSVQAFGVVRVADPSVEPISGVVRVKGATGPLDIVPLGWVARHNRIASVEQGGHNNSFNQNTLNQFGPDSTADFFDPKFNKDLVAESARANGVKVLTASLNPISRPRTESGNPFMVVDVRPENWSNSLELNKQRIGQTTGDNLETTVNKATTTNNPQAVVNVINKIKERNPDTGAAKIMKTMAEKSKDPDTAFAADVLTTFEQGLESGSSKQLKDTVNKKYGQVLDDNTALQLMANKKVFTAENAFDILHDGVQEGTANVGTAIMYKNNLMPLFEKINSNDIKIDGIPINSFYHKMPILADKNLMPAEDLGAIKPGANTNIPAPQEKLYEKYNTFDTEKKRQEFEIFKKEAVQNIEDFDIHGQESNPDVIRRMGGGVDNLINTYQWSAAEKQQAKDMMMDYAKDKLDQQGVPASEFEDNWGDIAINPKQGLNPNKESAKPTSLTSIYPDVYSSSGRSSSLGQGIAGRLNVEQLIGRAAKTNRNTFANDLQASANNSEAQGKTNTALLWNDVLKEFDRLGKSVDWRNKEIDTTKFNENMSKLSNDTITSGKRAGQPKTVNPEIANYEMDINVGKTDNLPKELQDKYNELQKEGYGHVYSSSSMNTNAYKGKTSGESSYNMFKYIKEYVEKNDDTNVVKEIYGNNTAEADKALEAIKTWRLGDELTTGRLSSIEKSMYGDKAPGIAQKLEDRKIDLNKGVPAEMVEAGLSPVSAEDLKEFPEFNNPLSHAIMSLSKYNINDLSPEEISKLSKSLSYTLWPSVRYSLKNEPVKSTPVKKINTRKNDGKGGPGDSLAQGLFQGAKDFGSKVTSAATYTPEQTQNRNNLQNTVLWKTLNPKTLTQNSQLPTPLSEPKQPVNYVPTVDKNASKLGHIISMVESSGGKNTTNKNLDQGKYGYVVGFTQGTYNDIKKKASQGDTRYKNLLSKLNFETPESAKQSAVTYFNFKNNLYDKNGKIVGQKYTNPEDIYTNLYNASGTKNQQLARKNWQNVVNAIQNSNK